MMWLLGKYRFAHLQLVISQSNLPQAWEARGYHRQQVTTLGSPPSSLCGHSSQKYLTLTRNPTHQLWAFRSTSKSLCALLVHMQIAVLTHTIHAFFRIIFVCINNHDFCLLWPYSFSVYIPFSWPCMFVNPSLFQIRHSMVVTAWPLVIVNKILIMPMITDVAQARVQYQSV